MTEHMGYQPAPRQETAKMPFCLRMRSCPA